MKQSPIEIPLSERPLLSMAEFAALCGHHPSWAYRQVYRGRIKPVQDFGELRIPRSELERLMDSAKIFQG